MYTTNSFAAAVSRIIGRGVGGWMPRRIFLEGDVPEPVRLGAGRVFLDDTAKAVTEAMQSRGWLSEEEAQQVLAALEESNQVCGGAA